MNKETIFSCIWTAKQEEAIRRRGENLLISAAAGAGKTSVLVERIIRRVSATDEPPLDVDRLLLVTYTNAAALQMKEKLSRALFTAAQKAPDNRHLQRQLALLPRAQVSTLHSFCLDLVRRYFYLLDLDRNCRVAQSGELALLQEQVLDELLEDYYADDASGLTDFLRAYERGAGDRMLRALLAEALDKAFSLPEPVRWLSSLSEPYAGEDAARWADEMKKLLGGELVQLSQIMCQAASLTRDSSYGLDKYLQAALSDQAQLSAAVNAASGSWDEFAAQVNAVTFVRLPAVKKSEDMDENAQESFKALREMVKEAVRNMQKRYTSSSLEEWSAPVRRLLPLARTFSRLAVDFYQRWQEAKARRGILEFADLEHWALALLRRPEIGELCRAQFDEVLVDEYQDVNEVENEILQMVSNGTNLVMVGDIKQSIYRFRMAEPRLFMERFEYFGSGEGGSRVDLGDNFRSSRSVITAVNTVFTQLMSGGLTEINYDEAARLHCGRPDEIAYPVEVMLITGGREKAEERMSVWQREARLLAAKIKELLTAGYKCRDMAILLRSVRVQAPILHDELASCGIAATSRYLSNLYTAPEVQIMIALLQVLDNPRQDIPLAAVLHSPVGGFSLAELADLRSVGQDAVYLYDCLPQAGEKARQIYNLLNRWRMRARQTSLSELIQEIYQNSGFYGLCGAMPEGGRRQGNLRQLLRQAREYEKTSYKGLYRFLCYWERSADGGDLPAEAYAGEDAVTIMSIHQSKGLEFPVVFVAGMGQRFNLQDSSGDVLLDRHLGLGLQVVESEAGLKYPSLAYRVLARQIRQEDLAEELRLLYVAMTRAKERLILLGAAPSLKILNGRLSAIALLPAGPLPANLLLDKPSYLNWLLYAIAHQEERRQFLPLAVGKSYVMQEPDGEALFSIHLYDELPPKEEETAKTILTWPDLWQDICNITVSEELKRILSYTYPHKAASLMTAKWSVTSLPHLAEAPDKGPGQQDATANGILKTAAVPAEAAKREAAEAFQLVPQNSEDNIYARAGTATHYLLQHTDLSLADDPDRLHTHLLEILARLELTPEEARLVDLKAVANFWFSPLGLAARQAVYLVREQPFILNIEASYISPDPALAGEKVLVQGIIDLIFVQEDHTAVIIDYKTGRHAATLDEDTLRQLYGRQLDCYRRAVESIWRLSAVTCLYFTANGRCVYL